MRIVWDESKNESNRRKHGVSFEKASKLLENPESERLEIYDVEHSDSEDRFIAIGWVESETILAVYSEPADGVIRLISARPATKQEEQWYLDHMRDKRR
jgi:uncharacterized DUF497 family protein